MQVAKTNFNRHIEYDMTEVLVMMLRCKMKYSIRTFQDGTGTIGGC